MDTMKIYNDDMIIRIINGILSSRDNKEISTQ